MNKSSGWRKLQWGQLIVFLAVSALIWLRVRDGAGAVQTPEIRWISFLCWTAFFLAVLAVEWTLHILRRKK